MKKIHNKILTSNEYVNKLLLLNPQFDTEFEYHYKKDQRSYYSYLSFIKILHAEKLEDRLSKKEVELILVDYFNLPNTLNQLTNDQKLILIDLGYFLNELKFDQSSYIRSNLAMKGLFLDEYTYDSDEVVRICVVAQSHNLHILKNDKDQGVRDAANHRLMKQILLDNWNEMRCVL